MLRHVELCDFVAALHVSPGIVTDKGNVRLKVQDFADETVIAFPGTDPKKALDWLRDFSFWPMRMRGLGLVHAGFGLGARAAWVQLAPSLPTEKLVTFTGHSLGGALALCMAAIHSYERPGTHFRVVTFGAPRVGFFTSNLHSLLAASTECAVYGRIGDIVPSVPFRPWYRHGAKTIDLGSPPRLNPLEAHSLNSYVGDLRLLGV